MQFQCREKREMLECISKSAIIERHPPPGGIPRGAAQHARCCRSLSSSITPELFEAPKAKLLSRAANGSGGKGKGPWHTGAEARL